MKCTQTILLILISSILFSQAGSLDTSFGNEGKTITEFEGISAEANAMAVQSDGKIIMSGFGEIGSDEVIVAVRYMPNGEIDAGFADEGKFIFRISNFRDRSYGIAVDSLNYVFLTGITRNSGSVNKGFVIKLNENGAMDSTFAHNGIWISEEPDTREDFREILIQDDGKIVIAGATVIVGQTESSSIIVRLNPNGTLDDSFGQNGFVKTNVPDSYNTRFAGLNSKEDIITGGFLLGIDTKAILIKFTKEGEVDLSFGTDGIMIDNSVPTGFAYELAFQSDDKILLVAGVTTLFGRDFGLTRYNEDGTLDSTFGTNGKISTDFLQGSNTAHSIVVQEDGKIILSGFLGITPNHDYAISRYDSLGVLDSSFGNNGKIITDLGFDDSAFASAIQSDGKLLCGGNSKTADGNSSFSIARYFTEMETSTLNIPEIVNSISIFPNPSNGKFSLVFDIKSSSNTSIDLLSSNGQVINKIIDNRFLTKGENAIEIELAENIIMGLYFLRIETEMGIVNSKLLIEK